LTSPTRMGHNRADEAKHRPTPAATPSCGHMMPRSSPKAPAAGVTPPYFYGFRGYASECYSLFFPRMTSVNRMARSQLGQ
jgi:hypothetical protein